MDIIELTTVEHHLTTESLVTFLCSAGHSESATFQFLAGGSTIYEFLFLWVNALQEIIPWKNQKTP